METKKCKNCGFIDNLKIILAYGGEFEDPNQKCRKCDSGAYEILPSKLESK